MNNNNNNNNMNDNDIDVSKKRKLENDNINIQDNNNDNDYKNINGCSKKGVNILFLRRLREIFSNKYPDVDINFYQMKDTIKEWTTSTKCSLVDELSNTSRNDGGFGSTNK